MGGLTLGRLGNWNLKCQDEVDIFLFRRNVRGSLENMRGRGAEELNSTMNHAREKNVCWEKALSVIEYDLSFIPLIPTKTLPSSFNGMFYFKTCPNCTKAKTPYFLSNKPFSWGISLIKCNLSPLRIS